MTPASVFQYPSAGLVNRAEAMTNDSESVLAICPDEDDRIQLREIFRTLGTKLYESATWREGAEVLRRWRPQVVICEANLPDADWRQVLYQSALLGHSPRVIVISRLADESFWAEVLNLGGYDVLPKPLVGDEAGRVIQLACKHWKTGSGRQGKRPESLSNRRTWK